MTGDVLDRGLAGERMFVEFPRGGVREWIAVVETLLQEGVRAWTLPPDRLDLLPEALAIFGHRSRIGVSGLVDPGTLAAAAGAHFVTSPIWTPTLADAAAGLAWLPGGLTATEVAAAAAGGAGAVQVVPADALGLHYARTLTGLLPGVPLVATGRIGGALGQEWLRAGARAIGVQGGIVLPEDPHDPARDRLNDPGEVRRRARELVQLWAT